MASERESQIQEYKELSEALGDLNGDEDEDTRQLLHEVKEQLQLLAEALNATEVIEVTAGFVKVPIATAPPSALVGDSAHAPPAAENMVVLFPPSTQPTLAAPYEVFYDHRNWYACVVTGVVEPATPADRVQYKVSILGYPVEEVVHSDELREFDPSINAAKLRRGVTCHAIDPTTGLYRSAVVERLTLDGTVVMSFTPSCGSAPSPAPPSMAASPTDAPAGKMDGKEVELPLSHVITGTFYPQLRKRPHLTEEERHARRLETARLRRERAELEKQMKADRVAQDASDWQTLQGDLMGGSRKRKRR